MRHSCTYHCFLPEGLGGGISLELGCQKNPNPQEFTTDFGTVAEFKMQWLESLEESILSIFVNLYTA